MCGFDRADVIITVGYDMVEYHPHPWHPGKNHKIIHIGAVPSEVDEHYTVAVEVQGHVGAALRAASANWPSRNRQSRGGRAEGDRR